MDIKSKKIEMVDIDSIIPNPKKIPKTNYLMFSDRVLGKTRWKV